VLTGLQEGHLARKKIPFQQHRKASKAVVRRLLADTQRVGDLKRSRHGITQTKGWLNNNRKYP